MTGFRGTNLLRVNRQLHAEVSDLIQRKLPYVHVEIYDHGELADVLKRRVPAIVLPSSPQEIATVVDFKQYSMVLRVRSTHVAKHGTVKDVRHLMIVGAVAWADVVKAIASHNPSRDFPETAGGAHEAQPWTLSYSVQLLDPYGTTSSRQYRHKELCQPMFDYWWSDYEKVWIISAFDSNLAKTLSTRLRKDRWTSSKDFWLAMEELFVEGETKHKLGLIEQAYRSWREGTDLHEIMSKTKNWGLGDMRRSLESLDSRDVRENAISDMMRTMNGKCSSICLAFASNSDSASEKYYHAEQALQHCVSTETWIPKSLPQPPPPDRFAEVKRSIYSDMLRAFSILDNVKRDNNSVQDMEDSAVRLRLGGLVYMDMWYSSGGKGFFGNSRVRETTDTFMLLMREVDAELHGRIWQTGPG